MSKILFGTAAVAIPLGVAAPAFAAGNMCISTRDIVSSTPNDDGSAISFKMRDGSVWRNDLQGRCPDLKFDGLPGPSAIRATGCASMSNRSGCCVRARSASWASSPRMTPSRGTNGKAR